MRLRLFYYEFYMNKLQKRVSEYYGRILGRTYLLYYKKGVLGDS